MANIQEYTPQIAAPEPVGGMSPNVELAGAAGRGLEKFGQNVAEIGDISYRRDAQEQTADVYSHFADKRAEQTQKLEEKVQNGSLEVGQFMDDYDNDTQSQDLQSGLTTREGRNFFERQQARLRGHILQMANHGATVVASNQAKGAWQDGLNQTANSLTANPSGFQDAYESQMEAVDQLVDTGGLPASMKDKAIKQMGGQLMMSTIRGWSQAGDGSDGLMSGPEKARKLMESDDAKRLLTPDQYHQMGLEINRQDKANDIESSRAQKAIEEHQKADAEKWGQDNLEKLSNNALSTKDVLGAVNNGTLKWEQGEKWLNLIQEGAKQDVKTNPRTKNSLISRIVNPDSPNPITSTEDLMPYVGKGISITDFNQMNGLFKKTPEQQASAQGEKAMFDSARRTIRFKNPMTNQYDVLGEQKLAQFMSDYTHAKQDVVKQGGKVSDLTDSNNPLYFGSRLEAYQTSMQDQMTHVATDRTNKALGLPRTSPDDASGKPPVPVSGARKPNESPADYLKRMGK